MSKEEKESAETENQWRRPGLTNEQIADIKHALFPELTKEQIADIKQAFDCFDVDGSGAIDHDEMAKGWNVGKGGFMSSPFCLSLDIGVRVT